MTIWRLQLFRVDEIMELTPASASNPQGPPLRPSTPKGQRVAAAGGLAAAATAGGRAGFARAPRAKPARRGQGVKGWQPCFADLPAWQANGETCAASAASAEGPEGASTCRFVK